MRHLLIAVAALLAGCGGTEEIAPVQALEVAPRPVVDLAADGPIGAPTTAEGCRRDYCPTAWPGRVELLQSGGVFTCACACIYDPRYPRPRSIGLVWRLPDVAVESARAEWAQFCPRPER